MSNAIVSETPSEGNAGNPPDVAELFAWLNIEHLRYRDFQIPAEVSLFDACAIQVIMESDEKHALISRAASYAAHPTRSMKIPRIFNTNATDWGVFHFFARFSVRAVLYRLGGRITTSAPDKKHKQNHPCL